MKIQNTDEHAEFERQDRGGDPLPTTIDRRRKRPLAKTIALAIVLTTLAFMGGYVYATTFFSQTLPSANFVPNNPFTFCNTIQATQLSSINQILYACSDGSNAFSMKGSISATPSFNLTGSGFSTISLEWGGAPTCPGANSVPLVSGAAVSLGAGIGYSYCASYTSGAQFGAMTISWSG
jgi:hypothetical protein